MAIKKMTLSWITASDINTTKKFFVDTLGLTLKEETTEHGWIEVQGSEGGMYLGIGKYCPDYSKESKPGTNAVVTMTVDNIVATKKELEAKGVTFIDEIMEIAGHVKMVTFTDPDGNKFQLVEELH
jgi:predicted enzyme related to lactoylglutathione lyase